MMRRNERIAMELLRVARALVAFLDKDFDSIADDVKAQLDDIFKKTGWAVGEVVKDIKEGDRTVGRYWQALPVKNGVMDPTRPNKMQRTLDFLKKPVVRKESDPATGFEDWQCFFQPSPENRNEFVVGFKIQPVKFGEHGGVQREFVRLGGLRPLGRAKEEIPGLAEACREVIAGMRLFEHTDTAYRNNVVAQYRADVASALRRRDYDELAASLDGAAGVLAYNDSAAGLVASIRGALDILAKAGHAHSYE